MKKRWIAAICLALLFALAAGSVVMAQTPAPAAAKAAGAAQKAAANLGWTPERRAEFAAAAQALKLTPTQLFERLYAGEKPAAIAQSQGTDLKAVQAGVRAVRLNNLKQVIEKAVAAGRITAARANWLTQGLDNGWLPGKLAQMARRLSGR